MNPSMCILFFILLLITLIDICARWIPDIFILSIIGYSLVCSLPMDWTTPICAVFYLIFCLLISFFLFKKKGMLLIGGGDLKLFMALSPFLTPMVFCFLAILAGFLAMIFCLIMGMRTIPFAPCITLAFFICHFYASFIEQSMMSLSLSMI